MVDDGSRDQMGEVADEKDVIGEIILLRLTAIGVDQEGDLREGVERYADGQDNIADGEIQSRQRIEIVRDEGRIFEIAKRAEIDRDARLHDAKGRLARLGLHDGAAAKIVEDDRSDQQPDEARVPPDVEEHRSQRQECAAPFGPESPQQQEAAHGEGKEAEQKFI